MNNVKFYILNNEINDINKFYVDKSKDELYEVIRINNKVPLFVEMHYERLLNTFSLTNFKCNITFDQFYKNIILLQTINGFNNGNIRFSFYENNYIFSYMNNVYVDDDMVINGVDVLLHNAVRENRMAKVMNNLLRDKTNKIIFDNNIYEVLLVDKEGYITEGSRTNFFGIKENKIISPPQTHVLHGVTRRNVIELSRKQGLEYIEERIDYKKIDEFDGFILTGTITKILPINRIGNINFKSKNNLIIRGLITNYDILIKEYVKLHKI